MNCGEVAKLLAAYVLGALDPAEEEELEAHLAGCAGCCRLKAAYTEISGDLPLALAAASPLPLPVALKDRLLSSLPRSSGVLPRQGARPPGLGAAAWADASDTGRVGPVAGGQRRLGSRRWPWSRARTWSTLAALLVLVASLVWSARLSTALAQERKLAAGFAQLVGQQEIVLDVVDSSETVRAVLRSPNSGSPAYGKLYTRHDMAEVVVMAAKLRPPPKGQVYHLWLTRQGRTQLAGVLLVNSQGFGLLVFDAGQNGPRYDAAEITLQAKGGSAPVGSPILLWKASAA